MAKRVDHEQRKREIAEKAMRLFSQVGYDNVSLIMIAAAAGVSRTALYQYFCSKREVLDAAIGQVIEEIRVRCADILTGKGTCVEKLEGICHSVTDVMFEHKEFLIAVFDFVTAMVRTGADMNASIHTFTTGTRDAIRLLIEHGKTRGEFAPVLDPDRAGDILYSQFESCAMRIALGNEGSPKTARQRFTDIIKAISAWR